MTMRRNRFAIVFLIFFGIVNTALSEEKNPESINDIFECLMCPNSDCSKVLFDITNDEIEALNLRSASQKTLAQFISGASRKELWDKEDEIQERYGNFESALLWKAAKAAAERYNNMKHREQDIEFASGMTFDNLQELIAEIEYKHSNRWIIKHQEEAKLFFKRPDVQEILSVYQFHYEQRTWEKSKKELVELLGR